MTRIISICLAVLCLVGLCIPAMAQNVDCDATYCFTAEDFNTAQEELLGICITELPKSHTGTVLLGTRVLQPGDILTAEQIAAMTFAPLRTEVNQEAVVTYLPIYQNRVEKAATMTISIRGKTDKAPIAEDFAMETYKNLPNEGTLKVTDPEGQSMQYSVTRQPRRGEVVLREDGSFQYTPKKNKVGVDSFTYTATDPAGNVSREATVTIQILKPTDSKQYTDTVGEDCRFAAEWMRNTGLFVGECIGGESCFYPEKTVSRGEFLAMAMKLLEIPMDSADSYTGLTANVPNWLKPYLAAAIRSGLVANTPITETGEFIANEPVTGGEVAVMLQNALDLGMQTDGMLITTESEEVVTPTWTDMAIEVMGQNGIVLNAQDALTRGEAAQILYRVSQLAQEAPGMIALRMQQ